VVTPGYSPINTADLRLLVDADGDFTNATGAQYAYDTIKCVGQYCNDYRTCCALAAKPYFTWHQCRSPFVAYRLTRFCGSLQKQHVPLVWTKQSGACQQL